MTVVQELIYVRVCGVSQYITLLTNRLRILCLKTITRKNTARKTGRLSGKRIVYVLVVIWDRDDKHLPYHYSKLTG